MKHRIAGCMAVATIVAAGFASGSTATTPTTPAAASDACAVVTTGEVNAAFAPRVFMIDTSGPVAPKLPAKYAQVSTCTFVSKGTSARDMVVVTVIVRRAPSDETGTTITMMKEGAVKLGATPVDVADLGDSAYWINLGGSKRPNRQLNVAKGKRVWLIVGESQSKLSDADAVSRLTHIAQAALGRI